MSTAAAELSTTLGSHPGEVPRARRLVSEYLQTAGLTADPDTALLLTSELVTNALLHGRPPMELSARLSDGGLRVEVRDAARRGPRVQDRASVEDLTGRGLTLVEALSARWGWEESSAGKLVWFELDG